MTIGRPPSIQTVAAPRTLDELPGRHNAIQALRQRIAASEHATSLILYGPTGVGKRTLARIYGKAIVCKALTPNGPCWHCEECESGEANVRCIEVDPRKGDPREWARAMRAATQGPWLWPGPRVIIVAHADELSSAAFDILLKAVEESQYPVTFVFLALELREVRLAMQSRCAVYQLRPLDEVDTRGLTEELSRAYGCECDDEALALVAAESGGLPGRLHEIARKLAGRGEVNLASVREVLGLDWSDAVIASWQELLGRAEPEGLSFEAVSNEDPRVWLGRSRVLLDQVYRRGLRGLPIMDATTPPAFLHGADAGLARLSNELRVRAEERGIRVDELWRRLASIWLSNDCRGRDGIQAAWEATRKLITGYAA